jgi:hypothetical protein
VIVEVGLFRIPPDRTEAFEPVADDHRAAEGLRQRDLLAGFMLEGETEVFHVNLPDVERGLV